MGIQPIRKHVAPEIPDKLYFRIGDVARLCEVPAYVLRFWETEFPQLKPNKGGTGQRLYRKRDVEMALRIKSLLYDQGYTIPGARQVFKSEARAREIEAADSAMPAPARAADSNANAVGHRPAEVDRGDDLRKKASLRVLRDEFAMLLAILEQPLSSVQDEVRPAPRLQAMRPRLVPGSKPIPVPVETWRTHAGRAICSWASRLA